MTIRTEWSRAHTESPEVIADWDDCYGQGLDEGGVALLMGVDQAYVIEAAEVSEIRDLATRILAACDRFDGAAATSGKGGRR